MAAAQVAPGGEWVDVALLKDEGNAAGLMMEDGISTLTFYKGDYQAASTALRQQFGLVVAANPWLSGHLERAAKGVVLRHPANPSEIEVDALFGANSGFQPSLTAPYLETCTAMFKDKDAVVASGNTLLGKAKPVSRLTVAEAGAEAFSVVFSLSHAVGDGRTYYEVLKMLQPGAEVLVVGDETGRLVLPAKLRDRIGLDGEAVFAGAGDTFQIWHPDAYDIETAESDAALEELPEDFDPLMYLDGITPDQLKG